MCWVQLATNSATRGRIREIMMGVNGDFKAAEGGDTGDDSDEVAGSARSTLVSRNITVLGRRTSVRLEPEMWAALRDIARREKCRTHDICSLIQIRKNPRTSLTAAIRVFLMLYYRAASTEDGHRRAGHGDFTVMLRRARLTPERLQEEMGGNRALPRNFTQVQAVSVPVFFP